MEATFAVSLCSCVHPLVAVPLVGVVACLWDAVQRNAVAVVRCRSRDAESLSALGSAFVFILERDADADSWPHIGCRKLLSCSQRSVMLTMNKSADHLECHRQ